MELHDSYQIVPTMCHDLIWFFFLVEDWSKPCWNQQSWSRQEEMPAIHKITSQRNDYYFKPLCFGGVRYTAWKLTNTDFSCISLGYFPRNEFTWSKGKHTDYSLTDKQSAVSTSGSPKNELAILLLWSERFRQSSKTPLHGARMWSLGSQWAKGACVA